ncbi:hypothetical protein MATL_G00244140 [Megalops atlanticus]|uniref:Protein crumbs homolog 1 n=1 Tax=Megalops atlanticus TaxID=7932 RepID=A0A9D3PCW5_MEGAT|nr:hypothetical protein MATL_G00244140 [Megalops atlanticus]
MALAQFPRLNSRGCICLFTLVVWTQSVSPQTVSSPCLSEPCLNSGVCQEVSSDFLCPCPTPPGSRCEGSHKPCQPTHCLRNATCLPGSSDPPEPGVGLGYTCLCRVGYAGVHCERHVGGCASRPCRNGALCRSSPVGPVCFCVPGFQGERCHIEVDECASSPCRNGATCLNHIGSYACLCKPGYTGTRCELQVDECQSGPCRNGGSCHDDVNHFSCTCVHGFQGDFCEIDVDECESQPCQNGAQCTDGVNSYSCDCTESHFTGHNCDIPLPPCMSQPCLNGATCQEIQGNYTCNCWPGFDGRHCEVDISECSSNPCLSGGRCVELSWKGLYGIEPLLPTNYNQQHAAGFVCGCQSGFQGAFCEEDVNECDQNPCQNGGSCSNYPGGYTCNCSLQSQDGHLYGGRYCSEILVGCEEHKCQNGGTCFPLLADGRQSHRCECPAGFAGPECQTPTGFSFETGGYLRLEAEGFGLGSASWSVEMSFRTEQEDALLLQRAAGGGIVWLELVGGQLCVSEMVGGEWLLFLELWHGVADGRWHSVEVVLGDGTLRIRLLDEACGEDCERTAPAGEGHLEPGPASQTVFIGGLGKEWSRTQPATGRPLHPFLGCLRDVHLDSALVLPGDWPSASAVNLTPGCSWDRCKGAPCQNRGHCVSRWPGYQCECYRPYKGPNCSQEYITARFGSEDLESYAMFQVSEDPGETLELSLLVRTRKRSALLLALANDKGSYLRMGLEEGRVMAWVGNSSSLRGEGAVDDGRFHLLGVRIEGGQLALTRSSRLQVAAPAHGIRVHPGDLVHVGGLPDARATASLGGYFKGCIQDLRLGSHALQFYPDSVPSSPNTLESMVNIAPGCTADDSCMGNPCLNGGMCYSMWDDFTCTCPPSTAGRRCEEVMWCEMSPCPPTAVCQPVAQGFECVSNATFLDDSSMVIFRGSGTILRNLTSIAFHIRTRRRDAAVLRAQKGPESLSVSVQDSHLTLELKSGNHFLGLSVQSPVSVSDGEWHSVTLSMVTPGAGVSRWTITMDAREDSPVSKVSTGNLDFLRGGAELLVGGSGFMGCLSTVEIGGIMLPYLADTELGVPRPHVERFIKISAAPVLSGCSGPSVCAPDPCQNGGICEDLFFRFRCTCSAWWTGPCCEITADACTSGPCVHGNCSTQGLEYECACEPGYVGANCEAEADSCEGHQCAPGSTCLRGYQRYSCLCPPNRTGAFCDEEVEQIAWYIEHYPRPKLLVSVCGGERWNYTCYNGGNCTEAGDGSQWACQCRPGFAGQWCETDIDDCASGPCYNGGHCIDMVDQFHCVCDLSYTGELCELNLNASSLTSDLLLSVSLVTVALLLALSLAATALTVVTKRRATHGTYSPSRLEKEGSRVEMWSMAQTPPTERLI